MMPLSVTVQFVREKLLPEKPALLASGVTDEAAAAAEAALSDAQKLIDAQAAIDQANASLAEAQTELQDAQAALDADSENADLLAARDAAKVIWMISANQFLLMNFINVWSKAKTLKHLRSMQKNLSSILNLFCRKAKIFYMSASLPAFPAS